ncbi:DUF2381 family protein [Myxococcus sp. SDU36]|uniref:DUF2381 family protein n=1 Tax=Myxococcus sp. SDU36 TaxID=2831967 RepID=UPI002542F990|nr:DUF2381 family protein [Myxococcus sp. SDU36]WIG95086.1 DUF2381 family protein [Myxococcus sp. SDU36]
MHRLVVILVLLMGIAAPAQSLPSARERHERRMVLSGNSTAPLPELRIAAGLATLLFFDAPLDRGALELEGRSRFRLVDVGERVLALEPLEDLGAGERLVLRVRYSDGGAPEQGVFALVSHASEVDARVEVFRRRDSVEALRAELADARAQLAEQTRELRALRARGAASGPIGLVMEGLVDASGVQGRWLTGVAGATGTAGLFMEGGKAFQASSWTVVSLIVRNGGVGPWTAASARFRSAASGARMEAVSVRMREPAIAPGAKGQVFIEARAFSARDGEVFQLEVGDGAERERVLSFKVTLKARAE